MLQAKSLFLIVAFALAGSVRGAEYKKSEDNPNYKEKDIRECNADCTDDGLPICREDNTTWQNWCYHKQDHCVAAYTEGGVSKKHLYVGPCRDRSKDTEEMKKKYNIEPWPPSNQYSAAFNWPKYYETLKNLEGYRVPDDKLKGNNVAKTTTTIPSSAPSKSPSSITKVPSVKDKGKEEKKITTKRPLLTLAGNGDEQKTTTTRMPSVTSIIKLSTTTKRPTEVRPNPFKLSNHPFRELKDKVAHMMNMTHLKPFKQVIAAISKSVKDEDDDKEDQATSPKPSEAETTTSVRPEKAKKVPSINSQRPHLNKNRTCNRPIFRIIDPVCASNGKIYVNKWALYNVTCKDPTIVKEHDFSKCCKENSTDSNIEWCRKRGFKKSKMTSKIDSAIPPVNPKNLKLPRTDNGTKESKCPIIECPKSFLPTCATNGKFYRHPCLLEAAACLDSTIAKDSDNAKCCQRNENSGKEWCKHWEEKKSNKEKGCPTKCKDELDIICGSDGKTYGNKCELESNTCGKNVTVTHKGWCTKSMRRDDLPCAFFLNLPTCGTDGITYDNPCELQRKNHQQARNVTVAHYGLCIPGSGKFDCSNEDPCNRYERLVCASDGKTYQNACEFEKAKCKDSTLKFIDQGPCKPVRPIYPNLVLITKFKTCDFNCTNNSYFPVCGPDCKTYPNICVFGKKMCLAKKEYKFVRPGKCEEYAECAEFTRKMSCLKNCRHVPIDPVCGSDGVTYANMCDLEENACLKGATVTVEKKGLCKSDLFHSLIGPLKMTRCFNVTCLGLAKCHPTGQCLCDSGAIGPIPLLSLQPLLELNSEDICGTDGNTYRTSGSLNNMACVHRQRIDVAHVGACNSTETTTLGTNCNKVECLGKSHCQVMSGKASCVCNRKCPTPKASKWICGSDGLSYPSVCRMNEAACIKRMEIKKVNDGACEKEADTAEESEAEGDGEELETTTTTTSPAALLKNAFYK